MAKRGRKLTHTPETIRLAIEKYFDTCEADKVFPDYAGMRLALELKESDVQYFLSDACEDCEAYRDLFNYARDRRESFLVRRMTSDNKLAQGCLNALKQPMNGGYIDRPVDTNGGKLEVTLKVAGLAGGAESLK